MTTPGPRRAASSRSIARPPSTRDRGIGVGGAIAILGLALIVNSFVSRNYVPDAPQPPRHEDPR